jgi:hypothetical protein
MMHPDRKNATLTAFFFKRNRCEYHSPSGVRQDPD